MTMLTKFEAADWLHRNDRYCILTHRSPDGDTLGSAAALCRGLRAMGKTAHILENPEITEKYRSLHAGLTCTECYNGSVLISVDTAAQTLFPRTFAPLTQRVELSIDHHGSNSIYAQRNLVDADSAACGEIIYDLLNLLKIPLKRDIAEGIYVAVSTDTGCFRYSNTTARTLRVAAACMEAGVDTYSINMNLFETNTVARLRMNAYMAEHLELLEGGTIALNRIPLEVEQALGIQEGDMENVSNFARNVEGVKLAVTFRTEFTGATKMSVRSAPGYNAAAVCAALGGGGHVAAAGARLECSQEQARLQMLAVLREQGYLK